MDFREFSGNWQIQTINIVLKLGLLVGAVLSFVGGHLEAAVVTLGIFIITFLPIFLGSRFQVKIPPVFDLLAVIFIFASLFLGEVRGYYVRFWWWDLVLHISSGFLLGILGFLLVYVLNEKENIELDLNASFVALFAFAFAISFGVFWEIFEYFMDAVFATNMQKSGLQDTMWDLIVNSFGALVISILGWWYLREEGINSFLERWIDEFIRRNPRIFRHKRNK